MIRERSAVQRNPASPGVPSAMREGRFYGKYRGVVITNLDPEFRGRIMPYVPHIPGSLLNWAEPCVPYGGLNVGFYAIPPMGASVWIEFEGGNPNYPIWSGCFWEIGEFLIPVIKNPLNPSLVKVFKTFFSTFIMDDTPLTGGITLEVLPPAVSLPVTMIFDVTGATINTGASTLKLTAEAIAATSIDISQTAAASASTTAGATVSIKAGADASMEAGAAVGISAVGDASVEAGGAVSMKAAGNAAVQAGGTAELAAGAEASIKAGTAAQVVGGATATITSLGVLDISGSAVTISGPAISFLPA